MTRFSNSLIRCFLGSLTPWFLGSWIPRFLGFVLPCLLGPLVLLVLDALAPCFTVNMNFPDDPQLAATLVGNSIAVFQLVFLIAALDGPALDKLGAIQRSL